MVRIGSKAKREIDDYHLSRYACYLIVMNSDPRKDVVALGQTYFAIKTRQQELIVNYDKLNEDQKRLSIRREMIEHNKSLMAVLSVGRRWRKGSNRKEDNGYEMR